MRWHWPVLHNVELSGALCVRLNEGTKGTAMLDTWTKQPPTLPGWYWHSKCSWRDNQGPFAVLVEFDNGKLVGWVPLMDYTESVSATDDAWPGQWLGPIQAPPLPPNIVLSIRTRSARTKG